MGTFDVMVGVVVGLLATLAVVLALLIACFWLLGVLRRTIARSRPRPGPPAEGPVLGGWERRT